MTFYCIRPLY